jgi:3-oxoacyl-[acyl-carrier protein] reductase
MIGTDLCGKACRIGSAEAAVGTFLWLSSEQVSGYVTGRVVDVNGGQLMP